VTCLDACTDDTCADNCFSSESEACFDCLDDAFVACANAAGCQAEWDALICCVDACGDDDSCWESTCGAENTAYGACVTMHESCWESGGVCFPAM
jgi:hypothetical protein